MRFRQSFIEKVRESASIVEIIGQHTELKRSGAGQLKGLCPFPDHNEKTPSFSVSEDKNVYYCFGCGKSGNVFTFLETYRGMSFPESVEYLAGLAGLEPEFEEEEKGRGPIRSASSQNDKKTLLRLNHLAMNYFQHCLKQPEAQWVQEYCEKRNLSAEIIEKFKVGYSPKEWQALTGVLTRRQAPLALAEKNGLIKKKNQGEGYFDLFRERLMFPILSPSGEVLGFGGRVLGDGQPKYLNSPETLVFNKRNTLYGLHETAKHIRIEDQVILVEGYMDLLAMYAVGIKNTAAVLGTAFTEDHARKLKRYTKNVVVLMDGDQAGRQAAERSLPILLSQGLYPKQVVLPPGQDPDDVIQSEGAEALKTKVQSAEEFYLKFVDQLLGEYGNDPAGKVKLVDRLGPVLRAVADDRLKLLYFRETVDRLGVDEAWLKSALRPGKDEMRRPQTQPRAAEPGWESHPEAAEVAKSVGETKKWTVSGVARAEIELVQLALRSARFWHEVESAEVHSLLSGDLQACYLWLRDEYRQMPENFDNLPASLASRVDEPGLLLAPPQEEEDEDSVLRRIRDCIKRVRLRDLDRQLKVAKANLGSDPSKEDWAHFMEIQNQRRRLQAQESTAGK